MRQFKYFKEKYADAILFFRMGDFYETFFEDAKICARVLGLVLTARNKGENPIPLAGIPYHALDGYLKKMLQAGYKVAVCEQMEDPRQAKGVVKRDVVRIVTPGTLTDDMLLNEREDNFLCAVHLGRKGAALAWVDISTGHFYVLPAAEKDLLDELVRLAPREVLLAERRGELFGAETKRLAGQISRLTEAVVTERPGWFFDPYSARQKLLRHFGVATLEGFGLDGQEECICAAGAVLEYLEETQKTALSHIAKIGLVRRSETLQIDPTSLRSLEVLRTMRSESTRGTLLETIDQTLTGMGSRLMRGWLCMPLRSLEAIRRRQDGVQELMEEDGLCETLREQLKNMPTWSGSSRGSAPTARFPRTWWRCTRRLRRAPFFAGGAAACHTELLSDLGSRCDSMDELADLLERAIEPDPPANLRDGGVIREGFDAELDRLRGLSKDGRGFLADYQQQEIRRTGIPNLKIGFNKVFGYYIEINHTMADRVPGDYIRKQTVKNAERYITEPLKQYEEQVLTASEKALDREAQLFEQVRAETTKYIGRLQALAWVIATTDCLAWFAYQARRSRYVRPVMTEAKELRIIDGRHPVLAELMGAEFVPNDVQLGGEEGDLAIITGPNMAGKSTYIRQTALLVLLAHTGSFIPAREATVGLTDRIFTRVGASDELARGQSTFMVEMTETANILNNATEQSLVVLDEVGRGTSTYDGLSLAWAITEHLANTIRCRTLFATHYHELTELGRLLVNVRNLNVAVREWGGEVVFLHKIIPGSADKSYGIHVAKLAGIPRPILGRANEILRDLESTFTKEASGERLSRNKTTNEENLLFVERHKSVMDKLRNLDVNTLTPLEAINLLGEIRREME